MQNTVKLPLYLTWKALKQVIGNPYSRAHTWRKMFDPAYAHDPFPRCGKLGTHRNAHPVWYNVPTLWPTAVHAFSLDTIKGMTSSEGSERRPTRQEQLRWQFVRLRESVHESMKAEEAKRLKENPRPTEQELYMGAFREWLEPQVRDAMFEMFRKGYATQSSGFHGTKCQHQTVDGYFTIDEDTKSALKAMAVEVLGGADFGVPLNTHICILRFTGAEPSVEALKKQWDAVVAALPEKKLPEGISTP